MFSRSVLGMSMPDYLCVHVYKKIAVFKIIVVATVCLPLE